MRSSTIVSLAGSEPARSRIARSLAVSTVKLPLIWPEPPRIGSRICGAEITLSSSTIANSRPTFFCVTSPNLRAPPVVRRKFDDRLVGLLVEAGLRVAQVLAGHQRRFVDHVRPTPGSSFDGKTTVPGFGCGGCVGSTCRLHHVESELRRLADERLQARRVAEAGRLDQDAVVALPLDARLGRAELVDAAVDDLDRLRRRCRAAAASAGVARR